LIIVCFIGGLYLSLHYVSNQLKPKPMKNLFKPQDLNKVANKLRQQGHSQNEIEIILGELKQYTFSIGLSIVFGFIKIYNN
jgi:hypothetical protein